MTEEKKKFLITFFFVFIQRKWTIWAYSFVKKAMGFYKHFLEKPIFE